MEHELKMYKKETLKQNKMETKLKITNNWWLLSILGITMTGLGFWVYSHPIENYIALSIMFSVIMFISGIMEISFALSNAKVIKGWGWIFSSGIFDLILGSILITHQNLTMVVLPIFFGIWLIFRGIAQISRGFLLKDANFPNWGWSIFGGILVIVFGFMVTYNPVFGAKSIVIWTALSLIILGIFTFIFSLILKKLKL